LVNNTQVDNRVDSELAAEVAFWNSIQAETNAAYFDGYLKVS
jgi:hypothetical protein